jgi:uncharacterized protein YcfJ
MFCLLLLHSTSSLELDLVLNQSQVCFLRLFHLNDSVLSSHVMIGSTAVGEAVGLLDGNAVGEPVGNSVGTSVGEAVGEDVGDTVGEAVGFLVGAAIGNEVGEGVVEGVLMVVGALVTRTRAHIDVDCRLSEDAALSWFSKKRQLRLVGWEF